MNKNKTIIFALLILLISFLVSAVDDVDIDFDLGEIPTLPGGLAEMGDTVQGSSVPVVQKNNGGGSGSSGGSTTPNTTTDTGTDTQSTDTQSTDTQSDQTQNTQTKQTQEVSPEPGYEVPQTISLFSTTTIIIIIVLILLIIAGIIFYLIKIKKPKPSPILNYIHEHMKKGYSKDQIYQKFIQSGHKPEHIDHLFKKIK